MLESVTCGPLLRMKGPAKMETSGSRSRRPSPDGAQTVPSSERSIPTRPLYPPPFTNSKTSHVNAPVCIQQNPNHNQHCANFHTGQVYVPELLKDDDKTGGQKSDWMLSAAK